MQGSIRIDNVKSVDVMSVPNWETKHLFIKDGELCTEVVLTDESARALVQKLIKALAE